MAISFYRSVNGARWFSVALGIFTLTMLYGAYYTYCILPNIYFASAQIQVVTRGPDFSLESEVKFMRSEDFLLPIINDLRLDKTWAKRVYRSGLDALPPQEAVSFMRKVIRLHIRDETNIIDIRVCSEVPKEASDIANAIADRYEILREDAMANDQSQASPVQILVRAKPAEHPSLPNHVINLVISTFEGIFLSLAGACLVELAFWYASSLAVASGSDPGRPNASDKY